MQKHRHDGINDGGVVSPQGTLHPSSARGLYFDTTDRAYYGRHEGRWAFSKGASEQLKDSLETRRERMRVVRWVAVGVLVVVALLLVVVT